MGIPIDGISVLYIVFVIVLLVIVLGLFAHRQIIRLRLNNARAKPQISLKSIASTKTIAAVDHALENVRLLKMCYQPRLTDINTIHEHNNKPYAHRMIAVDEVHMEIDLQLERLGDEWTRTPGESTYAYLTRIKHKVPAIPAAVVQRISFLYSVARERNQKFEVEQLMELRSLISRFLRFLNDNGVMVIPAEPPAKGIINSFVDRLGAGGSSTKRRNRSKFGGSDGGRLLATTVLSEERVSLLPSLACEETPQRRKSDSRSALLE